MNNVAKHILVVDDDADIRIMIKMMLEYHGYAVTIVERAEHAEKMLRTRDFDLVIMDMLLSGLNGTDICSSLKQDKSATPTPIIMISAHPNAKAMCLNAGADDFVAKPFDMRELLSVIEHFISVRH